MKLQINCVTEDNLGEGKETEECEQRNHQSKHHDPGPIWGQRGRNFSRVVTMAFSS